MTRVSEIKLHLFKIKKIDANEKSCVFLHPALGIWSNFVKKEKKYLISFFASFKKTQLLIKMHLFFAFGYSPRYPPGYMMLPNPTI